MTNENSISNTASTLKRRKSWWARWWKKLLVTGIVLLVPLVWLGRYSYLRLTLTPEPRNDYWIEKINAIDPAPDGAAGYDKAVLILDDGPWQNDTGYIRNGFPLHITNPLHGPWLKTRKDIAVMCAYFESGEFDPYRDRVIALANRGWANPVDLRNAEWDQLIGWAQFLAVHARWALEERKDWEMATQDWITALKIARQCRRRSLILSFNTERSINDQIAKEMIYASQECDAIGDVRKLATELDFVLDRTYSLEKLIAGDCYLRYLGLDYRYVRHGDGWLDVPTAVRIPSPNHRNRIWNLLSFAFYDYKEAQALVDEFRESVLSCKTPGELHTRFQKASWTRWRPELLTGEHRFNMNPYSMSFPFWINRETSDVFGSRMRVDAGIAMLAIRKYKQDHGILPASIDAFVPSYCSMPIDYIDRQPLRYSKDGDSFVLYSIWLNGKDDEGTQQEEYHRYDEPIGTDYLFTTFERPESYSEILKGDPS